MMTTDASASISANASQGHTQLSTSWKRSGFLVVVAFAVLVVALLSFVLRNVPRVEADSVGERGDTSISFSADRAVVLLPTDCLSVQWQTVNAEVIRLNRIDVSASGEQSVCLQNGSPPTLSITLGEDRRDYALDIVVLLQNKVMLAAAGLTIFVLLCAVLLTPPVARRAYQCYAIAQTRVRHTNEKVSSTALLTRMLKLLRWLLVGVAFFYIAVFVLIAVQRLGYPYELEWMEGASVDTVSRVLQGQPLYAAPSIEYVSPIYGPVYFYVSALFAAVFGIGFLPLRLVSLLSALGCAVVIYRFVKRETASPFAAWLSAGLFIATFNATGGWFDLARVDSLFLFLLLLGTYAAKFHPSPRGYALAGLLFSLSILTKQAALIPVGLLVVYCLLTQARATIYLLVTMALVLGGTTLVGDYASSGWYSYFIFGLAEQQSVVGPMLIDFWRIDLAVLAVPMLLLIVLIAQKLAAGDFVQARFYTLLAVGTLLTSWLMRLHSGGWINGLLPAYAALSLCFGVGIVLFIRLTDALAIEKRSPLLLALYVACLVQFVALLYNPSAHIPTEQDRRAGDAFIDTIRDIQGDVLLFGHGYYAAMADKPGYQLGWSMVVLVGDEGLKRSAFLDEVNDAIAQQRFSALVGDNATFLHENFDPALNRYYDVEYLPYAGTEFLPVTGMQTRPTFLFTPRNVTDSSE